jgi:hypothetical protein
MNSQEIKITPEEQEQLDWCFAALTEEQIADCQEEAAETAGTELHQDEAAELLVKLYARIMIRNVQERRNGGMRANS